MPTRFLTVLASSIALTAGVVTTAAPGQNTERPGELTRANVWIQNRSSSEAIPVVLQDVATSAPIDVQVVGTPTVALGPTSTVQARRVRQAWEYRTVSIPRGQDVAAALGTAGMEGWEVTGVQFPDQSGTVILLTRPR
jgi:hypothetical protein